MIDRRITFKILNEYNMRGAGGHKDDHIVQVLKDAKYICKVNNIAWNDKIELAVLFHDYSLTKGGSRETHHLDSAKLFRQFAEKSLNLSDEDIDEIADAIANHRASNKADPTTLSITAQVVSGADRGVPETNLTTLRNTRLKRSIECEMDLHNLSYEDALQSAREHLYGKYGIGGYAWKSYPPIYIKAFKPQLLEQAKLYKTILDLKLTPDGGLK